MVFTQVRNRLYEHKHRAQRLNRDGEARAVASWPWEHRGPTERRREIARAASHKASDGAQHRQVQWRQPWKPNRGRGKQLRGLDALHDAAAGDAK
jgi:hypothetical protein